MSTRRFAGMMLGLALGSTGCVSTSLQADLARVHELTRAPMPQKLHRVAADVEPETDESVRQLLQQPLTADAAVRIALLNNRELRASLRDLGVARGRLLQAGLLPNPEFELELRAPELLYEPQAEFRVEYDLTTAVLAPVRSSVARADLDAARYRAAATVVEVGYNVRAAYYANQAAQQRLVLTTRALDAFAATRDAARALFEGGNTPELDVATQEVAYEAARATAAQIELELLTSREQLQRLLGLHGDATTWTIPDGLARSPEHEPPFEQLERKAIVASLELAETRSRLEATARRTGLSRAEGWLPDVSVGVITERESRLAGEPFNSDWKWGGVINFTLPLLDRRQGTTAATEAEFDAMMERYQGMAIDIRSATRELGNRLRSSHLRARQYQQVLLPARQRLMQQMMLQYNGMQIGVFQLLQARRDQLNTELAYVETLREYWTARAALDALLAGRRVGLPTAAAGASSFAGGDEPSGGH
jgi:cobalt-zinc-cadmium efflux system outer membrane protein